MLVIILMKIINSFPLSFPLFSHALYSTSTLKLLFSVHVLLPNNVLLVLQDGDAADNDSRMGSVWFVRSAVS